MNQRVVLRTCRPAEPGEAEREARRRERIYLRGVLWLLVLAALALAAVRPALALDYFVDLIHPTPTPLPTPYVDPKDILEADGRVLDASGNPVPGIAIHRTEYTPPGSRNYVYVVEPTPIATTGPDGSFRAGGFVRGHYYAVEARRAGSNDLPSASFTVPAEGTPAPLLLKFRALPSVRGVVVREDGSPVAGAWVQTHERNPSWCGVAPRPPMAGIATDAQGRFVFAALTRNEYYLEVTAAGLGMSADVPLNVGENQGPLGEIRIVLAPEKVLAGKVLTKDGRPLVGSFVEVTMPNGAPRRFACDAAGAYRVAAFTGAKISGRAGCDPPYERDPAKRKRWKPVGFTDVAVPNESCSFTLEEETAPDSYDIPVTIFVEVLDDATSDPIAAPAVVKHSTNSYIHGVRQYVTFKPVDGIAGLYEVAYHRSRYALSWVELTVEAPGYARYVQEQFRIPEQGDTHRAAVRLQRPLAAVGRLVRRMPGPGPAETRALHPVGGTIEWHGPADDFAEYKRLAPRESVAADPTSGAFLFTTVFAGDQKFRLLPTEVLGAVDVDVLVAGGADSSLLLGDLQVEGASLRVQVLDGFRPARDIALQLVTAGYQKEYVQARTTDAEGRATFETAVGGTFTLRGIPGSYARTLQLADGATSDIILRYGSASVGGVVTAQGKPVKSFTITLTLPDGTKMPNWFRAEDGRYQFGGLPDGVYEIDVRDNSNYQAEVLTRPPGFKLLQGEALTKDIALVSAALQGMVVDAQGNPAVGVRVSYEQEGASPAYAPSQYPTYRGNVEYTDASGTYRFRAMGKGRYRIMAYSKERGVAIAESVEVSATSGDVGPRLQLGLLPMASLKLKAVRTPGGDAIVGAQVHILDSAGSIQSREVKSRGFAYEGLDPGPAGVTGPDGTCEIQNIPPGRTRVLVQGVGVSRRSSVMDFTAGETATLDLEFRREGVLTVLPKLGSKRAIAGSVVTLTPVRLAYDSEATAADRAPIVFTVGGLGELWQQTLVPGEYLAEVEHKARGLRWRGRAIVEDGRATFLTLLPGHEPLATPQPTQPPKPTP